jgi:nicotinamide mononucleotide transporter
MRLNSKAWPIGIIAILLNGWLYWHKGIYADMVLEGIYFFSMGYGWYRWRGGVKNQKAEPLLLNQLSSTQWALLTLILCVVFVGIYTSLTLFTHSNVPLLDAVTTSLSLLAQWLMCHKIIVTWILWFITDALYALMYLNKNLPFHCGLMILYTGMAVSGYVMWVRTAQNKSMKSSLKVTTHTPVNL